MHIMRSIRCLIFALVMIAVSGASLAQVLVSVNFGPPALPVYEQPLCPGEGYIWLPGYWAWSPGGYYWVPGTWALAPEPGLLWTPGYWAFADDFYYWHPGYWGTVVGFYGGIPYGYGYPGAGYYGGYWRGRQFFYNRTVNNVSVTNIRNVYSQTVVNNVTTVNRVSYNGGPGGITARPTFGEQAAARQQRPPTAEQVQHERAASTNHELLASVNQGRPPVAATPKPAEFSGRGVVGARQAGAPYKAPSTAPSRAVSPTSRPEGGPGNQPSRPEIETRRVPAPRSEAPRPPSAYQRENLPRPENVPPPTREAHPQNLPHPQREARPENAPPREPGPPHRQNPPGKEPPPHNQDEERPR